jgi:hypothetical protein
MGISFGIDPIWASQTDEGRTHIATKGIVQSGLVLNLDAGVSSSYPGSGNTWFDLSGNGNNGSLVNGVGFDSGNGGSLSFDGVNDYVDLPNNDDVRLTTNSWSIGIFFKGTNLVTTFPGYTDVLYTNRGSSSNNGFEFTINNQSSSNIFSLIDRQGTNGSLASSNNSYKPNTWQYVVFAKNDTEGKIYIDGNLDASNNSQPTTYTSNTNPRLGRQIVFSDYNFTGNITQVSIYNRALTPQEIQQNFNAYRRRFGI